MYKIDESNKYLVHIKRYHSYAVTAILLFHLNMVLIRFQNKRRQFRRSRSKQRGQKDMLQKATEGVPEGWKRMMFSRWGDWVLMTFYLSGPRCLIVCALPEFWRLMNFAFLYQVRVFEDTRSLVAENSVKTLWLQKLCWSRPKQKLG